jgi:hypothetical protein
MVLSMVEHGDSESFGREAVGVGAGDPLDKAMQAEAAQVIRHLVAGVVAAEESGHQPAKAFVGEAGDGVDAQHKAPARAMARVSPNRNAPVRWPSRM